MITKVLIKKNQYRDSVFLMKVNEGARSLDGIKEILIMMATENNRGMMKEAGFSDSTIDSATASDIVICIRAENETASRRAADNIEEMLTKRPQPAEIEDVHRSLESVMRERPETNFAIISVPGRFAARETKKALRHGLNVLLFSDNVSLEEEIELKKLASDLNRIVMGPDCGTAIINRISLGFANVAATGPIGLVSASGTGLQEVVSLIDRAGFGISQAIGTGGRDLSEEVGGMSMLKGIEILDADDKTEVVVLISKPPGPQAAKRILNRVSQMRKKVIINFLGFNPKLIRQSGGIPARTLEETASLAVTALGGDPLDFEGAGLPKGELRERLQKEIHRMSSNQKYIRGLYSGGTLCDEALILIRDWVGEAYSNIPLTPPFRLTDLSKGKENTCIDLGDDFFTKGRPHPMIFPEIRNRYIVSEAGDPELAVVLLDVVLGYGAHPDMAGELSNSIQAAKSNVEDRGGYLSVVISVCGTMKDPQGYDSQVKKLEEIGVVVLPSNAQAVRFAAMVATRGYLPGSIST